MEDSTIKGIATGTAVAGISAAAGALSKHATNPSSGGPIAMHIGSAVGAAAASGAGLGGSLSAGAAVVTAKVAAVAAVGVAAVPFVLAAGAAYGLYKIFKD